MFSEAISLFWQRVRNNFIIVKNSLWLISSEFVAKLVLFGVVVLLARYLGAEGYGQLQFALSFAGVFALAMDLGFNTLTNRELAREKEKYELFVPNVSFVKLGLFVVSLIVITVFLLLTKKSFEVLVLCILAVCYYLFSSFIEFYKSVFQAFEKMQLNAFSRLLYCALLLSGLLLLMNKKAGVFAIMLGYLGANFITFLFTLFLLLRYIRPFPLKISPAFIKTMFKMVFPFMILYIAAIINFRVDTIMISYLINDAAVGLYAIAMNLILAAAFIPSFCCAAVYPSLSRFGVSSARKLFLMFKGMFWIMLLIGALGAVVVLLLAKPLVLVVFGSQFMESVPVLQILALSFLFSGGALLMGYSCIAIDRQVFYTKIVVLSVLINIVLNYFLISLYGIKGAAAATIIAQFISFIVLSVFLWRRGFFFFSVVPTEPRLK